MERSVSAVEIFQNDSLSYVQVSFRVLRVTSDPQRVREISCDARSVNNWNIQTGQAIRGECVARGARKDPST